MDLSIVIVNWNGATVLKECLASVFNIQSTIRFEVVVVDNGSSDNSVEMVKTLFPEVHLVCNYKNLGFAAGNNRGFAVSKGRYVLLLNNDTIVLPGALDDPVNYMDRYSDVGALGCRIEFPDRTFQTSCYRFNDPLVLFMTRLLPLGSIAGEKLNYGRYWAQEFATQTDVDVVAGCFMLVRREIVNTIGGLDEDFFMYGEDEEWCARIHKAGWRIVYYPMVTIIHIHRFSSRHARRALRLMECMSPMLVLQKRCGYWAAWRGNLILLLGMTLRLPVWLPADLLHTIRGSAQKGLLSSRFRVLAEHFCGLVKPVWLPSVTIQKNQITHK